MIGSDLFSSPETIGSSTQSVHHTSRRKENARRGTCAEEALISTFHFPCRCQLSAPCPQESPNPRLILRPNYCCVPRIGLQSSRDQGRLPPVSSSPTLARRTSQPREPPLLLSEFPPRRLGGTFLVEKKSEKLPLLRILVSCTYRFPFYLERNKTIASCSIYSMMQYLTSRWCQRSLLQDCISADVVWPRCQFVSNHFLLSLYATRSVDFQRSSSFPCCVFHGFCLAVPSALFTFLFIISFPQALTSASVWPLHVLCAD